MDIRGTDHAYTAMWSMLVSVRNHNKKNKNKIRSVACAGFGAFVGQLEPDDCAQQMLLAYKNFIANPADTGREPQEASAEGKTKASEDGKSEAKAVEESGKKTKQEIEYRISWDYARSIQNALGRGGLDGFRSWAQVSPKRVKGKPR